MTVRWVSAVSVREIWEREGATMLLAVRFRSDGHDITAAYCFRLSCWLGCAAAVGLGWLAAWWVRPLFFSFCFVFCFPFDLNSVLNLHLF